MQGLKPQRKHPPPAPTPPFDPFASSRWCYPDDAVRPELPAAISFNKDAGRGEKIYVTVRLEDKKELLLGVDTGSVLTYLDKSLEPRLGEPLEKPRETELGWWGKEVVGVYRTPKLYLGKTQLATENGWTGSQVLTTDMSRLSSGHRSMMGLLGMDCLHHYCIQFDFAAGKMRFLDPEHTDPKELGKAFPLSNTSAWGHVTVRGSLLGTPDSDMVLDTGLGRDGELRSRLFQEALHEKRGIVFFQMKDRAGTGRMIREVRFPVGVFGGETYPDLVLMECFGDCDLIGLRFLARHLVTFNFPKRTMYLKRLRDDPLPPLPLTAAEILAKNRGLTPEQRTESKAAMEVMKKRWCVAAKAAAKGNPLAMEHAALYERYIDKCREMFGILDEIDAAKKAGDAKKQAAAEKAHEAIAAEVSTLMQRMAASAEQASAVPAPAAKG